MSETYKRFTCKSCGFRTSDEITEAIAKMIGWRISDDGCLCRGCIKRLEVDRG